MRAIHVLLSLLLSVGIASVFPETYGHEPKGHKFIPAGPGDSRSPCPWLNALANHDYLPRNGRRITRETVEKSFEDTLNFAPGSLEGATAAAITTGKGDGTFDLADTVKHNVLEHDASWSRNDVAIGDALVFDPIIWNRTASHFKSATISVDSVAAARLDRIATAQALNPLFNLTPDGLTATFANHALWLVSFGDRVKGDASTLFTRVVFEQERLPFKEGFVRPSTPIVGSDVTNMVKKLQSATIRVGLAKIPEHGGHSEHRG